MIGLLKKDFYVADRTCRLLLVLALVFSVIPQMASFGSTYALMLAMMVPLNCIAYDEKSKWDRYAAMLPYKTAQLVGTKYLLAYLFMALAEVILILGTAARNAISPGSTGWVEFWQLSAMLPIVTTIVTALALPALYRFGSEKGRLVMLVIMGVGIGIALGLAGIFGEIGLPKLPTAVIVPLFVLLAAAVTYVSFRLSVSFYKKRQNGAYT